MSPNKEDTNAFNSKKVQGQLFAFIKLFKGIASKEKHKLVKKKSLHVLLLLIYFQGIQCTCCHWGYCLTDESVTKKRR